MKSSTFDRFVRLRPLAPTPVDMLCLSSVPDCGMRLLIADLLGDEIRPRQGRAREALRWEHAAALAAEARALCALRHRMAGRSGPIARPSACSWRSARATRGGRSPTGKRTAPCAASARRCSIAGWEPTSPSPSFRDNSVDHALLSLGAMHVGVPVAPVSPAYSLMSKDFGKLKSIFELVKPGLVFAAEPQKFGAALEAIGAKSTPVTELLETNPGSTLEREHAR